MKTTITILLGLFVWITMPIEAMADRGDKRSHQSTVQSHQNNYARYGQNHNAHRDQRNHRHQSRHQKIKNRYQPPPQVRYVTYPVYRTYNVPSGYVYTTTPGVSLYFSW